MPDAPAGDAQVSEQRQAALALCAELERVLPTTVNVWSIAKTLVTRGVRVTDHPGGTDNG